MKGKYNSGVHATLLAAVGGYILSLAWVLFGKDRDQAGELPPGLNIIAINVYAWTIYRKGGRGEQEEKPDDDQDKK